MGLRLWGLEIINKEEKDDRWAPGEEVSVLTLCEEGRYVFEERAAILEFDGHLSREEAEKQASESTRAWAERTGHDRSPRNDTVTSRYRHAEEDEI